MRLVPAARLLTENQMLRRLPNFSCGFGSCNEPSGSDSCRAEVVFERPASSHIVSAAEATSYICHLNTLEREPLVHVG